MATQLGGTITVSSVEGKYTRFCLSLPLKQHFKVFNLQMSSYRFVESTEEHFFTID